MDHVEGESRLLVQEIMDLVNKEFTKNECYISPNGNDNLPGFDKNLAKND